MDKYEIIAEKLRTVLSILSAIEKKSSETEDFLKQYIDYIKLLKKKAEDKTLEPSNGGLIGLMRWLSDYYELEQHEDLWNMITDIENYYSKQF